MSTAAGRETKEPTSRPKFLHRRDFHPYSAIATLLRGDAEKQVLNVLSAGFCAWLVAPKKTAFINGYMIFSAGLILHNAALKLRKQKNWHSKDKRIVAELIARLMPQGNRRITEEFFLPLGGLGGLVDAESPSGYDRLFEQYGNNAERIAHIVGYLHALKDGQLFDKAASLKKAQSVYLQLEKHNLQPDTINKAWKEGVQSAAWAYAAAQVRNLDGDTLLDLIKKRKTSYRRLSPFLEELAARAVYIRDYLGRVKKSSSAFDFSFVSEPSAMAFASPSLDEQQLAKVQHLFKSISKAR